ncbi:hypothetical protein K438DRAFT_1746844 [Mycena galopus ATCC 62051]|nr:hypothetical protein K438DRAFT_1746844 [Mycena galopus ATCC 62051]
MASSSRSKLPPEPELGEYHANDSDTNKECSCLGFEELADTGVCVECFHKQKAHLTRPANKPSRDVGSILSGMQKKLTAGSSTSSTLAKISLACQQLANSGSRKKSKAANREANEGMRPTKEKGKGKSKDNSSNIFKVSSIAVLPFGVKFINGVLQLPEEHQKIPDKLALQTVVLHGLAVKDENGIELDRTWSHEEFTEFLTAHLPKPFAFLGCKPQDEPTWYLGVIHSRRLEVAPIMYPTGSDAEYNMGANTTGFRHNRLWILACHEIPSATLKSWIDPAALQFRVLTSDIDHDGSVEDENESHRDASDSPDPPSRRLKRCSTDNNDQDNDSDVEEPPKKRKNRQADLPEVFYDEIAQEISGGSDYIDLTAEDARRPGSGPLFLPATPPPLPMPAPTISPAFKVDESLGDPYAPSRTFTF